MEISVDDDDNDDDDDDWYFHLRLHFAVMITLSKLAIYRLDGRDLISSTVLQFQKLYFFSRYSTSSFLLLQMQHSKRLVVVCGVIC